MRYARKSAHSSLMAETRNASSHFSISRQRAKNPMSLSMISGSGISGRLSRFFFPTENPSIVSGTVPLSRLIMNPPATLLLQNIIMFQEDTQVTIVT